MESPYNSYLESVQKQFLYYKSLGEKALQQLDDQQWFIAPNPDSNSIAMIVNHLSGNMKSRWTDFLTTDGEKEWRDRDAEFEDVLREKSEVLAAWESGWACVMDALISITDAQLGEIVYIRNEGHTVMDAINRQLAHYPYHIGQIVLYAKLFKGSDWQSLSIPKNGSKHYNNDKFSKEKSLRHFTDDELERLK